MTITTQVLKMWDEKSVEHCIGKLVPMVKTWIRKNWVAENVWEDIEEFLSFDLPVLHRTTRPSVATEAISTKSKKQ